VADIASALQAHGLEVQDRGNLSRPGNPWLPPVERLPPPARSRRRGTRPLHDAVYAELQHGRLPIVLGGDHCLGIGSISAVARHCRDAGKKLRVLWLDAHADFNTNALTPSGNIHGMPVACLCGFGPQELIEIGGHVPAISAQVGAPDRHPQRGRGRKALGARAGPGSVRHALHRRDGHARRHGTGAGRCWTPTPTCM